MVYVFRNVFRVVVVIYHKVGLAAPLLVKIKQSTVLPQLGTLQCTDIMLDSKPASLGVKLEQQAVCYSNRPICLAHYKQLLQL